MNVTESKMQDVMRTAVTVWSRAVKSIVSQRLHRSMELYPSFACNGSDAFTEWGDGRKLFE